MADWNKSKAKEDEKAAKAFHESLCKMACWLVVGGWEADGREVPLRFSQSEPSGYTIDPKKTDIANLIAIWDAAWPEVGKEDGITIKELREFVNSKAVNETINQCLTFHLQPSKVRLIRCPFLAQAFDAACYRLIARERNKPSGKR